MGGDQDPASAWEGAWPAAHWTGRTPEWPCVSRGGERRYLQSASRTRGSQQGRALPAGTRPSGHGANGSRHSPLCSHGRSAGPGQSPGRGWCGPISTSALTLGNGKHHAEMCTSAYMQVCASVCGRTVRYTCTHVRVRPICPLHAHMDACVTCTHGLHVFRSMEECTGRPADGHSTSG